MSTPKPVTSNQAPGGKGTSAKQHTSIGGGSRPNGPTKIVTESSAPKSAQKIRG